MLKKLLSLFKKKPFPSTLKLPNWCIVDYELAMFSIIQFGPDHWVIEVSFVFDTKAQRGFVIPLQPIFVNYVDAFMFLQGIINVFCNTFPDVTVFDSNKNLIGRLDLSKPVQQDETLIRTTHSTNYTIN